MKDPHELDLLGHHNMSIHSTQQPVCFLEIGQLQHESYHESLRSDLASFLGMDSPLPAIEEDPKDHACQSIEGRSINICDAQYKQAREVLLDIAKNIADWVLECLMDSPLVVVSSRGQFKHLIALYRQDPCEELFVNNDINKD